MVEIKPYNFLIKNLEEYYLFRYFPSLDRLESFLTDGIYLSRADKFSDNLECISKEEMTEINKFKSYKELYPEHNPHLSQEKLEELKEKFQDNLRKIATALKSRQLSYFISCWYISDNKLEDELMWRSYGKGFIESKTTDGFMIRINLKDFMQHFSSLSSNLNPFEKLIIGQVRYFDYSIKENIKTVKYAGFRKHASFSGEKEFRVLFINKNGTKVPDFIKVNPGFYDDTIIYSHPNIKDEKFLSARNRLKELKTDLNMSELQMWYKLKNL